MARSGVKTLSEAQQASLEKAHSPEARAKAQATRRRNLKKKKAARKSKLNGSIEIPIDMLPDRPQAGKMRKLVRTEKTRVLTDREHTIAGLIIAVADWLHKERP